MLFQWNGNFNFRSCLIVWFNGDASFANAADISRIT